jgi:CMP-N,N'-diacetyllegionaminic acid synthase
MIIGIVPARAGSKRTPGKNLADVCGKPLIAWTLETARKANIFDQVIVTSDSDDILEVAAEYCPEVILHKRPGYLAEDETSMLKVIRDVWVTYRPPAHHAWDCTLVTLQPTSPLRRVSDITNSYEMLQDSAGDSVFSVTEAPDDLVFQIQHANRLRQLPDIVVPNGALFLITGEALDDGLDWFNGVAYGYRMPKDRSLDIDTPLDLEIARMVLR